MSCQTMSDALLHRFSHNLNCCVNEILFSRCMRFSSYDCELLLHSAAFMLLVRCTDTDAGLAVKIPGFIRIIIKILAL